MRIVFMGTPDFAVPSLKRLIEDGHEICAVVTQPDKPKGRGCKICMPPVKVFAAERGIQVFQPQSVKTAEFVQDIKNLGAEVFVTAAFGRILTKDILDIPPYGCINVHASLLPHLRGAAPIQWAIVNGDKVTGITTMLTDIGLDTGDMLLKEELEITEDMNAQELHDLLSELGASVLSKTIKGLKNGEIKRIPQDSEMSTYAPMIKKEHGLINWNKSAQEIHNHVRGFNPFPTAYTSYCGDRMRVWKTTVETIDGGKELPGTILEVGKQGVVVSTGEGKLRILEIQFDSCKRMKVEEYLCGHKIIEGEMFGKEG